MPETKIAGMTGQPGTTQVQLSIDQGCEPISGTWQSIDDGQPHPFWGWLQLISALEQARQASRAHEHESSDTQA